MSAPLFYVRYDPPAGRSENLTTVDDRERIRPVWAASAADGILFVTDDDGRIAVVTAAFCRPFEAERVHRCEGRGEFKQEPFPGVWLAGCPDGAYVFDSWRCSACQSVQEAADAAWSAYRVAHRDHVEEVPFP